MNQTIRFDADESSTLDYSMQSEQRTEKGKYLTLPVVCGELLLVSALLVGLFLFYQLKYTGVVSAKEQDQALESLMESWENGTTVAGEEVPGDATAILRVSKFDDGKDYPVLFGIDQPTLAKAPGIYPATQRFGEKGNTAIAAHRDGWNAPFSEIDTLQTCDVIEVETRSSVYTYKVPSSATDIEQRMNENSQCFNEQQAKTLTNETYGSMMGHSIVQPDKVDVIWPVPGVERSEDKASLSVLTMTSCHPHWSNEERYIVHAVNTEIKRKR